ncbi:hypothetical protein K4K54_000338 [Colletotrichum sp. SAR 10_86]|nr:hypothetical protein K4K54_000338 [Colletotrichum sp. SAR 10_86]
MDFSKAKICLAAYLTGLYAHIKREFSREMSRELSRNAKWQSTHTWFLFSYPTTWSSAAIERFRKIVESSGFGKEKSHWVHASYMDEAQAAMASFSTDGSRPAPGKIIVIADVGGGTTDVNTYGVEEDDGKRLKLKVETDPSGQYHGSVDVDYRVTKSVRSEIRNTLNAANNSAFKSMTLGSKNLVVINQATLALKRFEYTATKHGIDRDSRTDHKERYPLSLTTSAPPVATLEFKLYKALQRELRKECERIWQQIEEHIETLKGGRVDQLVFTGGMTKNALVRDWFEEKLESRKAGGSPKPIEEIIFSREPELSVSKGLVYDALQSYKRDGLWLYKSRHSYGVVVYNSDGQVETKRKFLAKDQVIDPKKFKEKQTIRFRLADQVDLRLARWDKTNANENAAADTINDDIRTVGSLTTGLPTTTEWEVSVPAGSKLNAK